MRDLLEALQENLQSEYKLSSTQIYVPNDIASNVLRIGLSISNDDLYTEEDGMGRELECHITVFYGLTAKDPSEVEEVVKQYGKKEISGKFLGLSLFESDKPYDVIKFDIDSEDLHTLHNLFKQLPNKETHPDYKPHCTVAYVRKGMGKKYLEAPMFSKEDLLDTTDFTVDNFYFCSSTGDKIKIGL